MNKLLLTNIGMLATPLGSGVKCGAEQGNIQILKDAWVTKYSGADLNASASEVAIETVELAYEELTIPD